MRERDIREWIRLLPHHPCLWSCSWASGGDGSDGSDSQGIGDDGGDGGSGDESKSRWLPANVIHRRRPQENAAAAVGWDRQVPMTARLMVVAVADRSRIGGGGVRWHGRRRLGPAAATRCGENDSARACVSAVSRSLQTCKQEPANL